VKWGLLGALIFVVNIALAQNTVSAARQFAADKNYDKSIDVYKELYGLSPDSVYAEYLHTLLAAKKYKPAEQLVDKQMNLYPLNPFLRIDLGLVYEAEGKDAKAQDQYEALVNSVNGDDM
jgi:predicted Zn-dependent protease